jgi:gliding motility-associated-like protein
LSCCGVLHPKQIETMKIFLLLFITLFSVTAFASIDPSFTPSTNEGCPPLLVSFTNNTNGNAASYFWDFGNGNTSTLQNPSAMFNTTGTYRVTLIAREGNTVDSTSQTITVFRVPTVNFYAPSIDVCANDTVRFITNVTPGDASVTDYAWDFGNGIGSSVQNANYSYSQAGIYDITLVVQDANNCTSNKTRHNYIQILPTPTASFTAAPQVSCNANELVRFTNNSTGTGLSYSWILDDSATSNLSNPTHIYHQEKRTVKLFVTDANGCRDTASVKVSVVEVRPDFSANARRACVGVGIVFTITSPFPGNAWTWHFGDGTTSTQRNPTKAYSAPGIYTVKLIMRDGPCRDSIMKVNYITITEGVVVAFTASSTGSCTVPFTVNFTNQTGGAVGYTWNFGNGDTSNVENPTYTYTGAGNFSVILTVTDTNGCSIPGTMAGMITTALPQVKFNSDTAGCPGKSFKFINRTRGAVSYKWYFGDGDSSTVPEPTHVYRNFGVYDVTLIATNSNGCDSTVRKRAYINIDSVSVDFGVNQTYSPCPPFVALFNNFSSTNRLKYEWNFGDGTTDTASNPTHVYFRPGLYTVSLTGTTRFGCSKTTVYRDLINVQGPTGQFSVTPTTGCVPHTVTYNASVSNNTRSMWCDLGNGNVVPDSLHFSYTYSEANTFNPKFILVDHIGCRVPYDLPAISVHVNPTFDVKDTAVCAGESVHVQLGNDSYSWSPSTYIVCDTCGDTYIRAANSTNYSIIASNTWGCTTRKEMIVHVEDWPLLFVPTSPLKVCKNETLNFNVGNFENIEWQPATYLDNANSGSVVCNPDATVTYHITATNNLGCSNTADIQVDVIDKLVLTSIPDSTICPHTSVQLIAAVTDEPTSGVQYTWSATGKLNAYDIANPVAYLAERTERYNVIVNAGNCVADTAEVTINVSSLPVIEVSSSVTTTANSEVEVYASSTSNLNYLWEATDEIACPTCRKTTITPTQSQTVFVTGTNSVGCSTKDSLRITVVGCDPNSIVLPNTFTPNGDGTNDKLFIRSNALSSINYFRVFDEWGKLVYESKDLAEGWDGNIKGSPAATSVYIYTLQGTCDNGKEVLKNGDVMLLR